MRYNCCKYTCDHNGVSKYIKGIIMDQKGEELHYNYSRT